MWEIVFFVFVFFNGFFNRAYFTTGHYKEKLSVTHLLFSYKLDKEMTAFFLALNALQIHSAKPWFNLMHLQPCFYIFIFSKGLPSNLGQSFRETIITNKSFTYLLATRWMVKKNTWTDLWKQKQKWTCWLLILSIVYYIAKEWKLYSDYMPQATTLYLLQFLSVVPRI